MNAKEAIETKRAEGIDRALRILDELEATLKGLRTCLSSERPGFPNINDAHQSVIALMLLTAHHNTLLDVEQKMGAK